MSRSPDLRPKRHDVDDGRSKLESLAGRERRRRDLKSDRAGGHLTQPHHMPVIVGKLDMNAVLRVRDVGREVSVNDLMGMVGVGRVQMLRRRDRRKGDARRQNEADAGATERGQHLYVII